MYVGASQQFVEMAIVLLSGSLKFSTLSFVKVQFSRWFFGFAGRWPHAWRPWWQFL